MKVRRLTPAAKVLAPLIFMASLAACRKAPESDAAGSIEPGAPALSLEEPVSDVERAKKARATALAGKEATKRAIEFAQSASAAAKNAAAAAERAAAAADAAVEAIRKIALAPPLSPPATPKPAK